MTDSETPIQDLPRNTCEWCSEPIKQAGVGRRRRYCSGKCRQQASLHRRYTEGYRDGQTDAAVASPPSGELPKG